MNTAGDSLNAWPLRKEKVEGLLRFHQADIFNVQEALPEQMDDLMAAFPVFNHLGVGLILTGDMNLSKNTTSLQLILGYLSNAMDKTITPHYGHVSTSGGFAVKNLSRKIDYIIISDKVKVLRHGHLSDSFGLFYPSDHLPVLAELRIN